MLSNGAYYHLYNRGINRKEIFFESKDYDRFIQKYFFYLGLSIETLSYCLLKNHIHFLIKVLSEAEVEKKKNEVKFRDRQFYVIPNETGKKFRIETLFGHLFNSHTKYINLKYGRSGTLWDGNFKKREIDSEEYLQYCICYIHRNPIHHGLTNSYEAYPYSSYKKVFDRQEVLVNSKEVFKVFGSIENYRTAHQEIKISSDEDFKFEDT